MAALINAQHESPLEASEFLYLQSCRLDPSLILWKSLHGHWIECSLVKMVVMVQFALVKISPGKSTKKWKRDEAAQFLAPLPIA